MTEIYLHVDSAHMHETETIADHACSNSGVEEDVMRTGTANISACVGGWARAEKQSERRIRVRLQIIRHARTHYVGKSQSCMS